MPTSKSDTKRCNIEKSTGTTTTEEYYLCSNKASFLGNICHCAFYWSTFGCNRLRLNEGFDVNQSCFCVALAFLSTFRNLRPLCIHSIPDGAASYSARSTTNSRAPH